MVVDNVYEQHCKILTRGIPALKYNFSNDKIKSVIIHLSADRKSFEYSAHSSHRGFYDKLIGRTKVRSFKDFTGLLYGGQTMSFGRHKKSLVKLLKNKHANDPFIQDKDSDQYEVQNASSCSEE